MIAEKKKRQAKKERLESEKKKRTEEKKQLMKLKKLQIVDRLKEIQKITGIQDEALKGVDLDEEFDPEKYEKQMASVFNDDYYNKNDDDEKPVFDDDENEFYDYYDENFHEQTGDRTVGESGNVGEEEGIVGGGTSTEEGTGDEPKSDKGKNKKKNKKKEELSYFHTVSAAEKFLAEKKKEVEKLDLSNTEILQKYLEEYYQLDYEDMIGDLPCKFKYIKVRSDNYGIDSASILGSDEKELNRIVSLKKLRPYRDDQGKVSKKIRGNFSKKKA